MRSSSAAFPDSSQMLWTKPISRKMSRPTIEQILYSAKALLRQLEQTDTDGTDYYELEEAKILHNLIDRYERKKDND